MDQVGTSAAHARQSDDKWTIRARLEREMRESMAIIKNARAKRAESESQAKVMLGDRIKRVIPLDSYRQLLSDPDVTLRSRASFKRTITFENMVNLLHRRNREIGEYLKSDDDTDEITPEDIVWTPFAKNKWSGMGYTHVMKSIMTSPRMDDIVEILTRTGYPPIALADQFARVEPSLRAEIRRLFDYHTAHNHFMRVGIGCSMLYALETLENGERKINMVPRHYETELDVICTTPDRIDEDITTIIERHMRLLPVFGGNDTAYGTLGCIYQHLNIMTSAMAHRTGSSYIALPASIKRSKALINVKNADQDCLLYALSALRHYDDISANRTRPTHYTDYNREWFVDPSHGPYPVDKSFLSRFEEANEVRIYIHAYEHGAFCPLMPSSHHTETDWPQYNLLYLKPATEVIAHVGADAIDAYEPEQTGHYVAIRNTSVLVRVERTIHHNYVCPQCYYNTRSEESWALHNRADCSDLTRGAVVECPDAEHLEVKFKAYNRMLRLPVIMTLDYEAIFDTTARASTETVRHIAVHVPSHIAITTLVDDAWADDFERYGIRSQTLDWDQITHGPLFQSRAIEYMLSVREAFVNILEDYKPPRGDEETLYVPLDEIAAEEFMESEPPQVCHICGRAFDDSVKRVIDHDHRTGQILGLACDGCNINMNHMRSPVPVFIHNLRGYDEKFLIPALSTFVDHEIGVIANTQEKFLCVRFAPRNATWSAKHELTFQDSMAHFGETLDKQVTQLCKGALGSQLDSSIEAFMAFFPKKIVGKDVNEKMEKELNAMLEDALFVTSPAWSSDVDGPRRTFERAVNNPDACAIITHLLESRRDALMAKFAVTIRTFGIENAYLFCRKGAMPYQYLDSWDKLREHVLPPRAQWVDVLAGGKIGVTERRYNELVAMYERLHCASILEFQRHYIRSDTTLLMDCMENWRSYILEFLCLDPAHYVGTPGIAWDAMLLHIKANKDVRIDNMSDLNMYHEVSRNIRGGISVISGAHAMANNPRMPIYDPSKPPEPNVRYYDPSKPTVWIQYLDANQLYGCAMKMPMPTGNYRWVPVDELPTDGTDLAQYITQGPKNRFYTVDLHCPESLHDEQNDYPMLIHMREARYAEQSEVTKRAIWAYYGSSVNETIPSAAFSLQRLRRATDPVPSNPPRGYNCKVPKLIPSVEDEIEAMHHARNLEFMIAHGIQVTRIHRAIEFDESPFMAGYIDKLNAERVRWKSSDASRYAIVKLLACAVYGRCLMDVTKHKDVKLETDEARVLKLASKFNCKSVSMITNELRYLDMGKKKIVLTQPIAIGYTVLEMSKLIMQRFYYDVLYRTYGSRLRLLMTDTDSLVVEIHTDDLIHDIKTIPALGECYDLSQEDSADFSKVERDRNCGIYGKFKTELPFSNQIVEFIGLRAKMYALLLANDKLKATAKGIDKRSKDRSITWETYRAALFDSLTTSVACPRFVSHHLEMSTVIQRKSGLISLNDKRYMLGPDDRSLAFGHSRIAAHERE